MNEKVKEAWLSALKSGEYKQGKNALKTNDEFCCLGVLCDLYHKKTGNGEWVKNYFYQSVDKFKIDDCESEEAVLPPTVMIWAGLTNNAPLTKEGGLAELNDNGKTFIELAELIEKEL